MPTRSPRALALLLCASVSVFMLISASADAAERFGREGSLKVRVPHEMAADLVANGGELVADYGSFAVVEVPNDVPIANGAEPLFEENLVLLNTGPLDTTQPGIRQLQQPRGEFIGRALHLVQFAAAPKPEWFAQLERTGVEIITYIPSNTYLVYGSARQIADLQTLAGVAPHIQWDGEYLPDFRIQPRALKALYNPELAAEHNYLFAIQLVQDPAANRQTLALIDRLKLAPALNEYEILNYHNIIVPLPPALVPTIAAQPDVVSVELYVIPVKNDERQDQIVAGNLTGNLPSAPGYLAWLTGRGFTQAQFDASNFAVDVSDSGIDNATTSPNHFGLYVNGTRPGTSRIVYNRLVGTPNGGSTIKGCDGHGTINTHIVCGYNNLTAVFPHGDASGYRYGLGVCPFVRAGSSVVFDPSTFTSPNYANLQSMAYRDSARISTNSWGANVGGAYNSDAQSYDALVRDAQPTGSTVPVAGNQEMVIVFSAGNAGSAANTIGAPGTAKNIITVGAAEGVQAFGGSDLCGYGDTSANSANDIIGFSSRGPCDDGRKKPEIVAPGTHISGGVIQVAAPGANGTADGCFTGNGVCGGVGSDFFPAGQQWYTASDGTSHSCPAVAGGCALIRQFFINQGVSPPSPAMTKAMLMNSARYMNGTGANDTLWSNSQGMGMMNLGEAFNRGAVTATVFRDQVAGDIFTATGQTRVFTGTIADVTKPFRVTLCWTDAPGPTSGNAFKNNLDLTVTIGANTYKGNVFSGQTSITGGSADLADNSESVFLAAGVSGSFTVTVTGTSINSDGVPNFGGALDQDFALVIYNGSTGSCTAPTITTNPSPQTLCAGGLVTFSVAASGTAPLSYQWQRGAVPLSNGGAISGAQTATLTLNPVAGGDAGSYSCVVSNSCGTVTSSGATLTVNTPPSITTNPSNATPCNGSSASFTVAASGTAPLTYQWRKGTTNLNNGGNISGTTGTTLTINPVGAGDVASNYNCVVSNLCGSATSTNASLTIASGPVITGQPASQTVNVGDSVGMTVTPQGQFFNFTYQWRKNGVNLSDAGSISGSTSQSLAIDPVAVGDAGNYDCIVTAIAGGCSTNSNVAVLTVNSCVAPGITGNPASQSVCAGSGTSFTATATGTAPLTYQWRKNTVNIGGATAATFNIAATVTGDAGSYDCVVTNGCGNATSTAAALTVNTAPSITSDPSPQTVCSGTSVTFNVAASGTAPLTYQWRKNTVNIGGATSPSFNINPVVTGSAGSYDCVVTNGCGSATSAAATLTVNTPPTITLNPTSQTICAGGSVTFNVTSSGTAPLTYQWRKNTLDIGGATGTSLTINPVVTGDAASYDCVVTNGCGNATSTAAVLAVNSAAAINGNPSPLSQAVCSGSSVSIAITATGTAPITYQWRRGTTNLVNGGNVSGATGPTLTLNPIGLGDDAANYNCVVTNGCGNATSADATVTVNSGVSITGNPASLGVCPGSPASFSVTAAGAAPITYQWRKNTVDIGGATGDTFNIASVVAGDAGSYDCVVTNGCGSATSTTAALTVNAGPAIITPPGNQQVCLGLPASFSITAGGTGPFTYQWRKDTIDIGGATSATLSIAVTVSGDAGSYDCVVTNGCGSTTSAAATLAFTAGPTINSDPGSQTVCEGSPASFSVSAGGSAPLTYQWRKDTVDIGGATGSSYAIAATVAADAGSYDCVVTNPCGSTTSNAATLTIGVGATITLQPGSITTTSGSLVTFGTDVSGNPADYTYQWRKDGSGLADGGSISGATTRTLTINPVALTDAGGYDCVINSVIGGCTMTTNTATLTVNQPCIGDLDGNHVVDLSDLSIVLSHYGQTPATYAEGDVDGNNVVELSDISIVLSHYGVPCP